MPSLPYTPIQPRPQHCSDPYNGVGAEQYSMHHTHGGSSLAPIPESSSSYHTLEGSASWTPNWSNSGPQAKSMAPEQGFQNNYGATAFSEQLLSGACAPTVTDEGSPYFPGLSPLATHLPAPGSSGRMLLPGPAGRLAPITSSRNPNQTSVTSTPTVYPPESSVQSNDAWELERALSGTSQSSISTSNGLNSISPHSHPEMRRATTTAYVPIIPRMASREIPSSYNPTGLATAIHQGAALAGAMQADQSRDTRHAAPTSSFDQCQYPNSSNDGTNIITKVIDCEPTRTYGQHIFQPQPRQSPSYDALLKAPSKKNAKSSHKSSKSGRRDQNQDKCD